MKNIIFAGNIPYLACLILASATFYLGLETSSMVSKPSAKVAFVEKGATVAEALLVTKYTSPEDLDREITKPIIAVIKKYVDKGYLIIDASINENGAMEVTGIPKGAINLNNELRAAVKLPEIIRRPVTAAPINSSKSNGQTEKQ